jgi:hypothetical protein
MFRRRADPEKVKTDDAILRLLDEMDQFGPDSQEYATNLRHLERIKAMQNANKRSIDPNTLLTVAGKLGAVLLIVIYEQSGHAMVSKALGFVGKSD